MTGLFIPSISGLILNNKQLLFKKRSKGLNQLFQQALIEGLLIEAGPESTAPLIANKRPHSTFLSRFGFEAKVART